MKLDRNINPDGSGKYLNITKLISTPKKTWKGISAMERLLTRAIRDGECWIWTSHTSKDGYGRIGLRGKHVYAHRLSYELFIGSIPQGMTLDHLCKRRSCVNPKHLEAVTMRVNLLRGDSLQAKNARKTHCKRGHIFNVSNTYLIRTGGRACKECNRLRTQAYREKHF